MINKNNLFKKFFLFLIILLLLSCEHFLVAIKVKISSTKQKKNLQSRQQYINNDIIEKNTSDNIENNKDVEQLPFVIVICSYNNAPWVEECLNSVFKQKGHNNYRVIYIDDCSSDGTAKKVEEYIEKYRLQDKIKLIKNKFRHRKLNNIYDAFHSCNDLEVIVQLDGDDKFKDNQVLSTLNKIYLQGYWLVYGQFEFSNGKPGHCKNIPTSIINKDSFRLKVGVSSFIHPRTFYAWLFKLIKLEDLLIENIPDWEGQFYPRANDQATMYPMIEMAHAKSKFNAKVLYVYNQNNPISGDYVEKVLGKACEHEVRNKKKTYSELAEPVINRLEQFENRSADLLILAQNFSRLQALIESIKVNVDGVNQIHITYDDSALDKEQIKKLKEIYFDVHFVQCKQKQDFINYLTMQNDYIIFISDDYINKDKINIPISIIELERTFAYAFYFGLSLKEFEMQNVPVQWIKKNLYAWKYLCDKRNNFVSHNFKMVLYRTSDVITNLRKTENNTFVSIKSLCESLEVDSKKVGLFLKESKIDTLRA